MKFYFTMDATDLRILAQLQQDASLSNQELAARVQSTFESSTPETLGTLSLEHELAELSLQSYNLTMELQILQVHFKHAELDTEKQRLAILIDEMASRIGRLEAKRISTLHKAASLQV